MNTIRQTLQKLEAEGNLRTIPEKTSCSVDFSENDYLGIASDVEFRKDFLRNLDASNFFPSSSASRLLASRQDAYASLENLLSESYGRAALLFNSGYHANTGMVAALGGRGTLFLADKLVHASIIDGLTLSGSEFRRFRHNDMAHLERLIERYGGGYARVVIIAESIYSMDGDSAPVAELVAMKRLHPGAMLYIDEAHAVGVCGDNGLGICAPYGPQVDIVVGTFGKALASEGAFAVMDDVMRRYMVNRCRSLIFSTALSPFMVSWSEYVFRNMLGMDDRRSRLCHLGRQLGEITGSGSASHIQPYVVGDAHRVVALSRQLAHAGIKVLPIRTPTVPPATERLRFSLSATMKDSDMSLLRDAMKEIKNTITS